MEYDEKNKRNFKLAWFSELIDDAISYPRELISNLKPLPALGEGDIAENIK
jgi:hypothetical protein